MMKIRSAEFLAAVAIISSATALQVREHMLSHDTDATQSQPAPASLTICGVSRSGVIPAACETMRGSEHSRDGDEERTQVEHAPQPSHTAAPQIWV
jgi:hypothetical protein